MIRQHEKIANENLYRDYQITAKLVELYGEKYLPSFLRIHHEIEAIRSLKDIKILALKVASDIDQF
jgi:hypothetical protein